MLSQSQKQRMTLEQGLHLNQQMLQSIKLLELPALELRERIEEEIAINPALEIAEKKADSAAAQDMKKPEKDDADFFETAMSAPRKISSGAGDEKRQFIEGTVSRGMSLQDALLFQLRLQNASEDVLQAGELIICNIDEDGFNIVPPIELLTGRKKSVINEALSIVQSLDPQGCAVKDYKESLAVQGKLKFGYAAWEKDLQDFLPYLKELEKEKFQLVARETGKNAEYVKKFFTRLKELAPFPGRQFETADVKFVVPDIEVLRVDGEIVIKLNNDYLPALRVNPFFLKLEKKESAEKHSLAKDERSFVKDNIAGAKWFISAIHKRGDALLRVTQVIVERQRAFFEYGPAHIAPLTQQEVAAALEIDASTVSRLANSKYIQTEWGIFEARYFFSNAVPSAGGDVSKTAAKEAIKEVMTGEKRISDNEIARRLAERGITIARRTVAKYRGEMGA